MAGLSPQAIAASFPRLPEDGIPLSRACTLFENAGQPELPEDVVLRLLLLSGRAIVRHSDLRLFPPSDAGRNLVQCIEPDEPEFGGGFLWLGDRLVSLIGPFKPFFECSYSGHEIPLDLEKRQVAPELVRGRSLLYGAERSEALLMLDSDDSSEGLLSCVSCERLLSELGTSPGSTCAASIREDGGIALELRRALPGDEADRLREALSASFRDARRLLPAGLPPAAYACSAILELLPRIPGGILPPLDFLARKPEGAAARPLLLLATDGETGEEAEIRADLGWDLGSLGAAIASAFGLPAGKLHCFRFRGEYFGPRDEQSLPFEHDETSVFLEALALGRGDVIEYEHDFASPRTILVRPAGKEGER